MCSNQARLVEALAILQQHHDPESGLSVRFEEPAVTPEPAPTPGPAEASVQCPVRTKAASANAGTNAGPANASPDPCISVPTPGPAEAAPAESTPPRPMPAPTPFKQESEFNQGVCTFCGHIFQNEVFPLPTPCRYCKQAEPMHHGRCCPKKPPTPAPAPAASSVGPYQFNEIIYVKQPSTREDCPHQ